MKIDVTPHTSLLRKIGQASFSIWQSISELIANSLDAIPINSNAIIKITANLEEITVMDNGIGMTEEVIKKAVRMAWPMQDFMPYKKQNVKREFGLGMKTACASLGNYWSLTTYSSESNKGFFIEFDLDSWVKREGNWEADLVELDPKEIKLIPGTKSGTIINIKKLRVKPVPDKLKVDISRAYLPHIKAGDEFHINNEKLKEVACDLIPNTKVDIEFEVEGIRITGWGALMSVGSLTHYGFHWYRKGQLIEAYDKSFIPNHPTYRQIIGELYADEMPVNFTKKGFEKESPIWKNAINELPDEIGELLNEARKTRKERQSTPWSEGELKDKEEVMKRVGNIITSKRIEADPPTSFIVESILDDYLNDENHSDSQDDTKPLSKTFPITLGETELLWRHRFQSLGTDGPIVDYMLEKENQLLVVTNQDSPFSQLFENDPLLTLVSVADGIARFLVEELDYDCLKALHFKDLWLVNAAAVLLQK